MGTGLGMEMRWQTELYESRRRLQDELRRALSCTDVRQKRKLAREWMDRYSEVSYRELIACARNKKVAADIIAWDLEEFDYKKTR